jgi:biotin synthase
MNDPSIDKILEKQSFTREDRIALLSATAPATIEKIRKAAWKMMIARCGPNVYYRGLIEFSNICGGDCFYCGIRRSNAAVKRYRLAMGDILAAAKWCAEQGYGSVVFQSGERQDDDFIDFVVAMVKTVKTESRIPELPEGLGITLCVGEQTAETYRRFFDAGAHRYLLRIETSNPVLFKKIHPASQSFETRVNCLKLLRDTGFQVGTGVMIGLPRQTNEDLADDIGFFIDHDIDMIGMGPFIPHEATPLGSAECLPEEERLQQSLLMIAVTRLSMPDINIAATTALQALDPVGREKGLTFGANIIMPQLTPLEVRHDYLLYPGKPCLDESAAQCRNCLEARIRTTGLHIGYNKSGDSLHALKRLGQTGEKS